MTIDQITQSITRWQEVIQALEAQIEKLSEVIGPIYFDTPLFEAVSKLCDAYTHQLADAIGDDGEFLQWHRFENEFGARGHECLHNVTGERIHVKTPEDLARVILWGREEAAA